MKRFVTICGLSVLTAVSAAAGTIHDIRTGQVPRGTVVEVDGAVVTAVQNGSFSVTELPAGPYRAIWVFLGSEPAVSAGDVVDLKGFYRDNFGRDEINLLWPPDAGVVVTGSAPLPDIQLTTTEIAADPAAWVSAMITITDGMIVMEMQLRGQWRATSVETSLDVVFDDYFYDFATVGLGDCYNNGFGLYTWHDGAYVFKVLSVALIDCTIANEALSFGQLKVIYR
ncbi:hypothetical protein KKG45_06570 [bacterium]|nr:hypothetical protein [bacterium]MBU1072891.1 hypothetical protein [bacterium]MBU1675911.1 hypothetical protein [bacterium]